MEIGSIINVVSSFVTPEFHFLGVYVVARVVGGELRVYRLIPTMAGSPSRNEEGQYLLARRAVGPV